MIVLLPVGPVFGAAYKWVDEQGQVHYSDRPREGAEEIQLPQSTAPLPRAEASAPEPPPATFLDVILYSREQIRKETEAMGGTVDEAETAPWGIISVKAQGVNYELPMQPITMMRNALGKEEGGSGVALDRSSYEASVAFWSQHAILRK